MELAFKVLAYFVASQHICFFVLESFLWDRPIGKKIFRQTDETAKITKSLAVNQGVYNAFLAAGIIAGLLSNISFMVSFLLGCVVVAGIVGGATVSWRILIIQAVPAATALGLQCALSFSSAS